MVDCPPVIYRAIELIAAGLYFPGTALRWRGKHQVEFKTAISRLPSKGSCSHPKQGFSPPPTLQEVWSADGLWSPLRMAQAHPALPEGVGMENATRGS